MTDFLRRLAAATLASLFLGLPAHATSYSTDFTDLWWNPAESGWGVNVIQQDDTLFLTFFVYGPDNTARWYVASEVLPTNPQPADAVRFSGIVYRTTGPWLGGPFDPLVVGVDPVGTVTITFDSTDTATLSYTVDNVPVVKAIERQPVRNTSIGGSYAGGLVALASQCGNPVDNGALDILGTTTATLSEGQVTFRVLFTTSGGEPASCNFVGAYTQRGRMAAVPSGSFSCLVNGQSANAGVFTMSAVDAQFNGFHATFSGQDQFCTYKGRFGGTRDATG